MSKGPDPLLVAQARAAALASGLAASSPKHRSTSLVLLPDLLACTFDPSTETFTVTYADLTNATVNRTELADAGDLRVIAWEIDEFRRGVEIVLEDGSVTSFSAEYPRYLRDPEYRRRIDSRTERGEDLGERVAQRVRAFRTERGWTVAELARRAGIAAPNVHRVESGKHVPSSRTVLRLAQALEVPLARMLRVESDSSRRGASGSRRR